MGFKEPLPSELRPASVGCSVPRHLATKLQAIATARDISLSALLREALVKVYAAEPRDE
jgi:predicted transcriptional regulator